MIIYGQRTADGRIAFGGGERPTTTALPSSPPSTPSRTCTRCCARRSPSCSPRSRAPASPTPGADRSASRGTGTPRSGFDRASGLAWAGGYVGDGVATTNLAGRTLADLITGPDSDLTRLTVGRAPFPPLGTRTAALARSQRRAVDHEIGRPDRGKTAGATEQDRRGRGPAPGAVRSPQSDLWTSSSIANLIYSYAERIDAGDFAGVGELFDHATLTFEGFGEAVSGQEAIEALYRRTTRRYEDGTPRTKHVMTNVIVDVDDGREPVESLLLHRPPSGARRARSPARHRRTLPSPLRAIRRRWRVTSMHIIIDLVGELGHHMLFDLAAMKLSLSYDWSCTPEVSGRCTSTPTSSCASTSRASAPPRPRWCPRRATSTRVREDAALQPKAERAGTGAQDLRRGDRHDRSERASTRPHHRARSPSRRAPWRTRRTYRGASPSPRGRGRHGREVHLDARVKIFGAGPIVERFIERQARETQEKSVAFMRAPLEG